jgi:hypothetical protein
VPRLTQVSASSLDCFRLRACHALWSPFPWTLTNNQIGNSTVADPTTPVPPKWYGFGLFRFRSPLLSESRFLSFPPGTEMVHFPGFARSRLCIQRDVLEVCSSGFPHSEISGSTPVCGFPKLIAACHVLHRLSLPRHPPCALSSLTIELTPRSDPPLGFTLPEPSMHISASCTSRGTIPSVHVIILKTLNLATPSHHQGGPAIARPCMQFTQCNSLSNIQCTAVARCSTLRCLSSSWKTSPVPPKTQCPSLMASREGP